MINFAMYIYLFTFLFCNGNIHLNINDHMIMTVKCACARVTQHIYAASAEFAVCIKVLIMREVEAILYHLQV